jgi:hypothetical protein
MPLASATPEPNPVAYELLVSSFDLSEYTVLYPTEDFGVACTTR